MADALGIPLGTVRSRLNRARSKVREALRTHVTDPTPHSAATPATMST
nr:hypothetical protein [Streptomyces sp. SM10]